MSFSPRRSSNFPRSPSARCFSFSPARAFANATEFTQPLQEFITANAWGTVWCRGGIDLKTRSLVTVAMLTALGRQHELAGHLRGALNNGVPLAAEGFRCAEKVIDDWRREKEGG